MKLRPGKKYTANSQRPQAKPTWMTRTRARWLGGCVERESGGAVVVDYLIGGALADSPLRAIARGAGACAGTVYVLSSVPVHIVARHRSTGESFILRCPADWEALKGRGLFPALTPFGEVRDADVA